MVIDYLKRLTFLSKEEIEALEKEHLEAPERRIAHEALAREIITDLHGAEAFEQAKMISKQLFSGKIADIEPSLLLRILKDVPHSSVNPGSLVDVLVEGKICSSKRDAREMINGGAITINGVQVKDLDYAINKDMVLMDDVFVVRRGETTKKQLLFICNFHTNEYRDYRVGVPCAGHYQEVLNSDAEEFGGKNRVNNFKPLKAEPIPCDDKDYSIAFALPPLTTVVFSFDYKQPKKIAVKKKVQY